MAPAGAAVPAPAPDNPEPSPSVRLGAVGHSAGWPPLHWSSIAPRHGTTETAAEDARLRNRVSRQDRRSRPRWHAAAVDVATGP